MALRVEGDAGCQPSARAIAGGANSERSWSWRTSSTGAAASKIAKTARSARRRVSSGRVRADTPALRQRPRRSAPSPLLSRRFGAQLASALGGGLVRATAAPRASPSILRPSGDGTGRLGQQPAARGGSARPLDPKVHDPADLYNCSSRGGQYSRTMVRPPAGNLSLYKLFSRNQRFLCVHCPAVPDRL